MHLFGKINDALKRAVLRAFPEPKVSAAHRAEVDRGLTTIAAFLARGNGCWPAVEHGECCTCGHEWIPGEIIGTVAQAYVRTHDGGVLRSPGVRIACSVCVERQRVEGDLSLRWAREAGLL